jgi:hypothetical protein
MRLILILSLSALACGMSAEIGKRLPIAAAAPTPEQVQYYQAIGDVNIRETPNGIVIGALEIGASVRSFGVVVRLDGVRWCKHELGWSACEWLYGN